MFRNLLAVVLVASALEGAEEGLERADHRLKMVRQQIERRGIEDALTLQAMRTVPRHLFVPKSQQRYAYDDRPLSIGHGQTISQPYIVAYMTEFLQPRPGMRVLEVGTGSGYQAAILAETGATVYSIEIVDALAKSAEKAIKKAGYSSINLRSGDGYFGWEDAGPFDAIIVTAAAQSIPPPLIRQLHEDGRLIIPVGPPLGTQYLVLVTKKDGKTSTRRLIPVRFVPFTRRNAP
jgi:protein-L-isoaspartate(D-aspartate) O-methyltransferase